MKGAQEQDHLLFELGRLGEQMVEKNQEFGALVEKLSLTSRALQVAEEKIEHLEAVDKQRNHHFKELQHQCAQHEKEQREVSHINKFMGKTFIILLSYWLFIESLHTDYENKFKNKCTIVYKNASTSLFGRELRWKFSSDLGQSLSASSGVVFVVFVVCYRSN